MIVSALFAQSIDAVPSDWLKNAAITALAGIALWDRISAIRQRNKQPATVTVSSPVPPPPQPFIIQHAEQYVTIEAFRELKERVDDLHDMERRLNERGEARAEAIHQRINPLAEAITGSRDQLALLARMLTTKKRERATTPSLR